MNESASERRQRWADKVAERTATCKACPHYVTRSFGPASCGVCGCVVMAKVRLPGEKCPQGRW